MKKLYEGKISNFFTKLFPKSKLVIGILQDRLLWPIFPQLLHLHFPCADAQMVGVKWKLSHVLAYDSWNVCVLANHK